MSPAALRLVLLVSCAHALVHVYEISLPSVEQAIAADYFPDDAVAGKRMTGLLQTCWRLPWGLGALLAGWLVDRWGSRRMLAFYLLGAALVCCLVGLALPLPLLFVAMAAMGSLACIYHPAGLALISHNVPSQQLPLSLGIHGVFGSMGIGLTPILAGLILAAGLGWKSYYLVVAIPGGLLGCLFIWQTIRHGDPTFAKSGSQPGQADDDPADWPSFFTLTTLALMQGLVYSAVLSFLPRYLNTGLTSAGAVSFTADVGPMVEGAGASAAGGGYGALASGGVLLLGCVGQFLAGTWARSDRLERQLTWITLSNVPFLLWMSVAMGWQRIAAAGLFALIHFMHQPIYNSLIAKYSPRRRRSLCYGFSFAMGLGVGSLGAAFAGYSMRNLVTYGTLALVALCASTLAAALWRRERHKRADSPAP
jgi:FSR family fosmidomycin resistance protein-like MFS transporter